MTRRRLLIPAIVVVSVAAGGVGGALIGRPGSSGAQEAPAPGAEVPEKPERPEGQGWGHKFEAKGAPAELEAAAKALGLTIEQLRDKLADGTTTIADVAEQQKVDLDTVIDAMAAADRERIEEFVTKPLPQRPEGAPGKGFGHSVRGGESLAAAAKVLDLSVQELRDALWSGKSLADVAKEKNVDAQRVIDALVADANARIDEAQANGKLTEEQAVAAKAQVLDTITSFVQGEVPKFGWGPRLHGGLRGGPHDSREAPKSAPTSA